jgi:hypothetical protein
MKRNQIYLYRLVDMSFGTYLLARIIIILAYAGNFNP